MQHCTRRSLLGSVAALFAVLPLAQIALAQSAAPAAAAAQSPEEVVVTAQKRSENVQKVPISITVISADQLTRRGVQTMQDLSQASASLEFTGQPTVGGGAFVRGIGTSSLQSTTATSSVGMVLDGVVLGNLSVSDIFDISRVEVLKGPQGTLFGSSVSAGLLNITTNPPRIGQTSADVNGEVAVGPFGSEYGREVLRATVNLPVTSDSALRIAAEGYQDEGLTKNVYSGSEQQTTDYGVRARYLLNFNNDVTFNLIADYNISNDDNDGGLLYRSVAPGSQLAQALQTCGIKASSENIDSCSGEPRYGTTQLGGISGQFTINLGGTTLTSISSYRESQANSLSDILGIAPDIARAAFSSCNFIDCAPVVSLTSGNAQQPDALNRSLVTQEVRLTSPASDTVSWVAGLYYQHQTFSEIAPGELVVHPSFLGFDLTLTDATKVTKSSSNDYAAFGNLTYHISRTTRLIAGLRYTYSDLAESEVDPSNTGNAVNYLKVNAQAVTFRTGLEQDLGRSGMVYATVSSGYKPPQINDNLSNGAKLSGVQPERPISGELGIKESLFDRRLSVAADVFYSRFTNFQTQSCVPNSNTGILCSNINVPQVDTKGIELELFGHPFPNNTLNLSGIYNIAKYPSGFFGADGSDLAGHQLNYAPKVKVTISTEQAIPLSETYSLTLGGDATIRDQQSMYLSASPAFVVPGEALFNARVSLRSAKGWSLSIFGRNLTDRIYPVLLYPTTAFAQGGVWQVVDPNSRRLVGIQLEAKL